MRSLLALLALTSVNAATHAQAGGLAVALPFEDVPGYGDYHIATRTTTVIRDAETWQRLHDAFYSVTTCDPECRRPPPPPVDFERQMVILAGDGETRCALSEPARLIRNVERRGGVVFVWVGPLPEGFGEMPPSAEGAAEPEPPVCFYAIDYLVHMVTVERSDLPVLFRGLYGYVPPPQGPFGEE